MALKSLFPEDMMSVSNNQRDRNPLLSNEGVSLLQYRIQQEEQSSRIYQSMSLWLNNEGYTGAASLWLKYSQEELVHADFSRQYLLSMGVTPSVPTLNAETTVYKGLPQIVEMSYDHEIVITKQLKEFADKSFKSGDYMLYTLAFQFLKEQVEEHDKMQTWIDKLKAFGTDRIALRLLDEEMGK